VVDGRLAGIDGAPGGRRRAAMELEDPGAAAVVDGPAAGTYHTLHAVRGRPLVSVVVPNRDSAARADICRRYESELV